MDIDADIVKKVEMIRQQCILEEHYIWRAITGREPIDNKAVERFRFIISKSFETVINTKDVAYRSAILVSVANLYSKGWDFENAVKIIECIDLPSKKKLALEQLSHSRGEYIASHSNTSISQKHVESVRKNLFNITEFHKYIDQIASGSVSKASQSNAKNQNKSDDLAPNNARNSQEGKRRGENNHVNNNQKKRHEIDQNGALNKEKKNAARSDYLQHTLHKLPINILLPIIIALSLILIYLFPTQYKSTAVGVDWTLDRTNTNLATEGNNSGDRENQVGEAQASPLHDERCNAPAIICEMTKYRSNLPNQIIVNQDINPNQSDENKNKQEDLRRTQPYSEAENSFNDLDAKAKINFQLQLIASGNLTSVPDNKFSKRIFAAIRKLQEKRGASPTGILNDEESKYLWDESSRLYQRWGLKKDYIPSIGITMFVPTGRELGLHTVLTDGGIIYKDNNENLILLYQSYSSNELVTLFNYTVTDAETRGESIKYRLKRDNYFALKSKNDELGYTTYARFHLVEDRLVGFILRWKKDGPDDYPERLVNILSSSLYAEMTHAIEVDAPQNIADSATRDKQEALPESDKAFRFSGTGFFVSSNGYIVTNAHVINQCKYVEFLSNVSGFLSASIIAKDTINDIALLKAEYTAPKVASIRVGVRLGEQIAVYGFPLNSVLSKNGNFTLGNVTALAGIAEDTRYLQISAPVQSGNSGGPLVDQFGNVVGIVSAKMDAAKTFAAIGDVPQNVNFALKSSILLDFLEGSRVGPVLEKLTSPLSPADLADLSKSISVFVRCY